MTRELLNYDIYPKVIPVGKEVTITIAPRGGHARFEQNRNYWIGIFHTAQGSPNVYPKRDNFAEYTLQANENGAIQITHTFTSEAEYFIRVCSDESQSRTRNASVKLSVYAVNDDLVGRYPYMGDMHIHSTMSDGGEHPFIVVANYRKFGYDFIAVTDHGRFYPSLETMDFYKDLNLDMRLYPGEEVHLPDNDIHLVNFGGDYSVNGIYEGSSQIEDRGPDKKHRSVSGECPDTISRSEYTEEINALADTLDIPDGIERFTYAACVWICNHIKNGHGLSIFAHPYWINNVHQVPEELTEYMLGTQPFDAFEVFGGLTYFQQNGFQVQQYHDFCAKGHRIPIVGNTDSHGSTEHNPHMHSARTIVFAHENSRDAIVDAVKTFYNVAVQDINGHVEVLGDLRMMKYAWFLYENYFPIHDELCFEEGRLMKEYACGDEEAGEMLRIIGRRMDKLRARYFAF